MRKLSGDLIFWLHVLIIIFWYGLFFVPLSLWPNKIEFHFQLSLLIVGHQIIWGALIFPWTRKYRMVCMLTTIMQVLKGKNISDKDNYDYAFSGGLLRKINLDFSHRRLTVLTFSTLAAVAVQYFLL